MMEQSFQSPSIKQLIKINNNVGDRVQPLCNTLVNSTLQLEANVGLYSILVLVVHVAAAGFI